MYLVLAALAIVMIWLTVSAWETPKEKRVPIRVRKDDPRRRRHDIDDRS